MGLDMYAYRKSNKAEAIEIATWRKHNMLHGWMEKLYKTKKYLSLTVRLSI